MTRRRRLSELDRPLLVVGAIVVLGALLSWRHTRQSHEWLVMTDELQYLKLGLSLGDGAFPLPTLRGEPSALLSLLYPMLIAPVLVVFSAPEGYQLVHLVNAVLFASTAVPVYLLTRQVTDQHRPAYLAAALAVAVPWAATSAVVMTEAAAYPAFAWALLAIQRALVTPSPRRDLVTLVAIGVAFFARTQFLFLAGAFPLLIVLHEGLYVLTGPDRATDRRRALRLLRERLRPHALLGALGALGLVLLVLPGDPLKSLLGPFQTTVLDESRWPAGLGHALRYQLDFIAGGIGFVPLALAAGWALSSVLRPADRRSHAFAALLLVVGAGLIYVATVFAVLHAPGPADRYTFYLAPLLLVAACVLLAQGRPRPLGLVAGALFTFWVLRTGGVPFTDGGGIFVNSQASDFHRVYGGQISRVRALPGLESVTSVQFLSVAVLVATTAVGVLLYRLPRFALAIVGLPLLGLALGQTDSVSRHITGLINTSQGAINTVPMSKRDWVDEALPGDGDVAVATSGLNDVYTSQRVWWNVEFWNKRVNRAAISAGNADVTPFPDAPAMTLDRSDGSIATSDGEQAPFMLFARNQIAFRPQGKLLAEYRTTIQQDPGLELLELERPYRAAWMADGAAADGWIVRGTPARIQVFPRADGRAQTLSVNIDLPVSGVASSPFELRTGGRVTPAVAQPGTILGDTVASVCVPPGKRRSAYISTRAIRPLPDGRKVGVHLFAIRVEAAGRACR